MRILRSSREGAKGRMFEGFQSEAGTFFWEMRFHNERDWFYAHKDKYDELIGTPLKELAAETYEQLMKRFPEKTLKVHIARIWRDARRLYGRGPLKENLWFSIENTNMTEPSASFFFEIQPALYSYGLGFWTLRTDRMEAFRRSVDANPATFERLARSVKNMKGFVLGGPEFKRPKGDHGEIVNEWYNRKWTNVYREEDFGGDLLSPRLPLIMADDFTRLMPMFDYLNEHTIP